MTEAAKTHPYSRSFLGGEAVRAYGRKFDLALESVRHNIEAEIIGRWASGSLFDCSIGSGRFIGALPNIERYAGMDYSQDFVDLVRGRHPHVEVKQGNLLDGIDQPDAAFDTVICIRTLSALGHLEPILLEATRILKRGGKLIFDYGVEPSNLEMNGEVVPIDAESLEEILAGLPLSPVEQVPLDGVLVGIKRNRILNRAADAASRFELVRMALASADRLASRLKPARVLHVLERR